MNILIHVRDHMISYYYDNGTMSSQPISNGLKKHNISLIKSFAHQMRLTGNKVMLFFNANSDVQKGETFVFEEYVKSKDFGIINTDEEYENLLNKLNIVDAD